MLRYLIYIILFYQFSLSSNLIYFRSTIKSTQITYNILFPNSNQTSPTLYIYNTKEETFNPTELLTLLPYNCTLIKSLNIKKLTDNDVLKCNSQEFILKDLTNISYHSTKEFHPKLNLNKNEYKKITT